MGELGLEFRLELGLEKVGVGTEVGVGTGIVVVVYFSSTRRVLALGIGAPPV